MTTTINHHPIPFINSSLVEAPKPTPTTAPEVLSLELRLVPYEDKINSILAELDALSVIPRSDINEWIDGYYKRSILEEIEEERDLRLSFCLCYLLVKMVNSAMEDASETEQEQLLNIHDRIKNEVLIFTIPPDESVEGFLKEYNSYLIQAATFQKDNVAIEEFYKEMDSLVNKKANRLTSHMVVLDTKRKESLVEVTEEHKGEVEKINVMVDGLTEKLKESGKSIKGHYMKALHQSRQIEELRIKSLHTLEKCESLLDRVTKSK